MADMAASFLHIVNAVRVGIAREGHRIGAEKRRHGLLRGHANCLIRTRDANG